MNVAFIALVCFPVTVNLIKKTLKEVKKKKEEMNRKTDVVATYIQLILLIFLHWSLTFMLFIDQCRTR